MTAGRRWYPLAVEPVAIRGKVVKQLVDPLAGPKVALGGRIVTMDDQFTVRKDGVLFLENGVIVAVRGRGHSIPAGFEAVPIVETNGTIFPGLIELHNHLSYGALPLWAPVPKRFTNRDQWGRIADYRTLISGPMTVIGKTPALLPALVRYVEAKCLLAGVTTTQGVRLASNAGVVRYYRGLVRNAEQTDDPDLPEVDARIADVVAKDAKSFLARVGKASGKKCILLHLSEGKDVAARKHFLALEVAPNEWAINDALAGIHAAALTAADFQIMAERSGAIVWSPLSNLLLYGDTAAIADAKAAGIRIGLGSDWSPTGSKNLLGELKVAWLWSEKLGGLFSEREVVAMATRNGADILKWSKALGSLEAGKRADLLVIDGTSDDPYRALIRATEKSVQLVMINGVARYGITPLMEALSPGGEKIKVAGESRRLFLTQETADPDVRQVTLKTATSQLKKAFRDIVKLARALEKPKKEAKRALDRPELTWTLALDEIHETGADLRPRLPFDGPNDFTGPEIEAAKVAAGPLSSLLSPIVLDPLTVMDDAKFLDRIEAQPNLPDEIRTGLRGLY
ncbi:MAG: amidohydrolase family protein [Gemmatimonadota bacterium]